MIEQIATVVAVEGDSAWVETRRQGACGACAMNKGCGAGLFARAFGFDSPKLKVTPADDVEVGDRVVIGIDEQALVRGSFAAYMMPILFMLGFAMVGEGMTSAWPAEAQTDLVSLLSGLLGLVFGLMWLKRHSRHILRDRRYQPLILQKAGAFVSSACPESQS
jgi:sigma-E factor negative regulatory protein RseC